MRFLILLLIITPCVAMEMSYSLIELESKKTIIQKDAATPKYLASVSKLFTNYYALKTLGENFQFTTKIYIKGNVEGNILKGDLYLVGGGDPYLTSQHLISLIHQIQQFGIKTISGNFYLDDQFFPLTHRLSTLGLEDQPDNPSLGGLNAEFNRIKLWNFGNQVVSPIKNIQIKPKKLYAHGLKFKNISHQNGKEVWQVHTQEKRKFSPEIPSKDATFYTGELLRGIAKLHGLILPRPLKKTIEKHSKLIASHKGLPIIRLARLNLEYSNNLIAEALLLMAAKNQTKKTLTIKESTSKMKKWYQKSFPQINWKHIHFENGSGLSLNNKASTRALTNWLAITSNDFFDKSSFWSLMSISGHSGSLARRLNSPDLAYKIYGKTGSLFFVNNLAGYLIANSGKKYAFSILTNDQRREKLQGKNNSAQQKIRKNSKSWHKKSIKQVDQLLKNWILKY